MWLSRQQNLWMIKSWIFNDFISINVRHIWEVVCTNLYISRLYSVEVWLDTIIGVIVSNWADNMWITFSKFKTGFFINQLKRTSSWTSNIRMWTVFPPSQNQDVLITLLKHVYSLHNLIIIIWVFIIHKFVLLLQQSFNRVWCVWAPVWRIITAMVRVLW